MWEETMTTSKEIKGETPHGGDRSVMYYLNDKGESVEKDKATKCEVVEYAKGKQIFRTYADL
jgi:hypothetical protein